MKNEILNVVSSKKKPQSYIYFVLFLLLVGCGGYVFYQYKTPKKIIRYVTVSPTRGNLANEISATGTLNPLNEVQIGSQVSGKIEELFVDTNDSVKKGQILAKIDDRKILQELERQKAQLDGAKAQLLSLQSTLKDKKWQFQRLQKLHKQSGGKYPSFADVQNAQVAYEVAGAEVMSKKAHIQEILTYIQIAQIDYKNTIITSPIDGIVLVRSVDVGQTVAASFSAPELFKIAQNLKDMKLVVKIAESDIGKIRLGQKVSFSVDAYPSRVFEAWVNKINYGSSVVDNIVSYEISIDVENEDLLLRPGMSATANIQVEDIQNALLLPVEALYFSPKQEKAKTAKNINFFAPPRRKKEKIEVNIKNVWILKNKVLEKREVKVGISNGKYVQVEGISENDQVVLEEQER